MWWFRLLSIVHHAMITTARTVDNARLQALKPQGTRGYASGAAAANMKPSALAIATKLIRAEGIKGVYRGFLATCARDVPFSAIYFPLFAHLNELVRICLFVCLCGNICETDQQCACLKYDLILTAFIYNSNTFSIFRWILGYQSAVKFWKKWIITLCDMIRLQATKDPPVGRI